VHARGRPGPGGTGGTGRDSELLRDVLLRHAVAALSGPAGLASRLRGRVPGLAGMPVSLPLDVGRTTRTVPPHLRRAVIARDRHCAFPGCTTEPNACHVHHIIHWVRGGLTELDNLQLLCAFHHLVAIHRWGWTLTRHADGTRTAISPDGTRVLHSHGAPGHEAPGHGPPGSG
jgi:hypothetical protein